MKKKIFAVILLVALFTTIFSGCTFIKENKERAANEILATITSDGISLTVTRNEFLAYANYMLNQYSQYNYTPNLNELLPEILDYMINQKYLIIKGIVYLNSLPHRKEVTAAKHLGISANTPEGALTVAERYAAIKTVNETFENEIDGYVKEYETEQRNMSISVKKEELAVFAKGGYTVDEVKIKAGSFKEQYLKDEELDESKVFIEILLSKGDDQQTVTMPVNSTMYDEDKPFSTEITAEEQTSKVVKKSVVLVYEEPYIDKDGETAYLPHKTQPFEYTVVTPRGTEPKDEEENKLEGDVKDRYKSDNEIAAENKAALFDYNVSTTAALKEAYRQFRQAKKNMLINFDTDGLAYYYRNQYESAVLSAVRHEIKRAVDTSAITEEVINNEYALLVARQKEEYDILETDAARVAKFAKSIVDGTMKLDSTYYIPVDAIVAEGYELSEFFAIAHVLFKFDKAQTDFIDKDKGDRTEEELKELRYSVAQITVTSRSNPDYDPEYECPLHSHNEGECNYTGEGICPALAFDPDHLEDKLFGDGGIYEEMTAAIKAAATPDEKLRVFKDYMTLYNDDGGAMTAAAGYLITPEGIAHSYDGNDFPSLGRELYANSPQVGSAFLGAGEDAYLGYAFTSYGIHLMMISFIPFGSDEVSAEGVFSIDAPLDIKGNTHRDAIEKKLVETLENNAYTQFTKANGAEQSKAAAQKETKKFAKLLKDLGVK